MQISSERLTVRPDRGLVVFLIGSRVNHWWQLPILWGVGMAMGRMLRELTADPDSGLLSYESYGGRTTLMVQYWRSIEDLHRYAHAKEREHVSAWRRWAKRWGLGGAVGIWQYHHMPEFGLGKVGPLVPAKGELATATKRLGIRAGGAV